MRHFGVGVGVGGGMGVDGLISLCSLLLSTGYWRTREELKKLQRTDEVFLPQGARKKGPCTPRGDYVPVFQSWERALRRSMNWYSKT